MFLRTEIAPKKEVVGKRMQMSFINDATKPLFASFMPQRNAIAHKVNGDLLLVQNYPEGFFRSLDPARSFEKWASVEVSDSSNIPEGMETFTIPEGLYAVFLFKGTSADAQSFFRYVYLDWFPKSEFEVDVRPHIDVIGAKYKYNTPDSEEEIWIPIKKKK